jgi:hypothetical protein
MYGVVCLLSRFGCIAAAVTVIGVAHVRADILYNDTVAPDLSNDYASPTTLTLPYGTNSVILRTRYDVPTGTIEVDYLRVDLPVGGGLTKLMLGSFAGDSDISFLALQEGPAFTFDPLGNGGSNMYECPQLCLGFGHIGPGVDGMKVGDNLLVGNGPASGLDDSVAPGHFTPPMTAPNYTFWMQEFNGDVTFRLDFVVVPIHGDYNHDGSANAADYTVWRNTVGTNVGIGNAADGNGDGIVTFDDYTIWKNNFGFSGGSGTALPEPSTGLLLLIGMLASPRLVARRRFGILSRG